MRARLSLPDGPPPTRLRGLAICKAAGAVVPISGVAPMLETTTPTAKSLALSGALPPAWETRDAVHPWGYRQDVLELLARMRSLATEVPFPSPHDVRLTDMVHFKIQVHVAVGDATGFGAFHIPRDQMENVWAARRVLSAGRIEAFVRRYASLAKLAAENGWDTRLLGMKLKARGCAPIVTSHYGKLFLRAEVGRHIEAIRAEGGIKRRMRAGSRQDVPDDASST